MSQVARRKCGVIMEESPNFPVCRIHERFANEGARSSRGPLTGFRNVRRQIQIAIKGCIVCIRVNIRFSDKPEIDLLLVKR